MSGWSGATTSTRSPRSCSGRAARVTLAHSATLSALALLAYLWPPTAVIAPPLAKTSSGTVQGTAEPSGVYAFRGIPFAAPPVGSLRWQPPQPVKSWTGVRQADQFGPRCMQRGVFGDMVFRSNGMSEDCLYLNVWTPQVSGNARLPVLVYFYGGGFLAGDGSEPRYDGEAMARKGIVALTVNYRLNVFGFFAHPELTSESSRHASGNYGFLDQAAALRWVQQNAAAFGGDPGRVTIAGESAGSISVSALMASPLSKGLMAGAIGESGAMINPTLPPVPLADAEKKGLAFATGVGATSLQALRAMPAEALLQATAKPGAPSFQSATIDGYFLRSRSPISSWPGRRRTCRCWRDGTRRRDRRRPFWARMLRHLRIFRRRSSALVRRGCRRDPEAVSWRHPRRSSPIGDGPRERPVHRVQHVEVDGRSRPHRRQAGLPLLLHPPAAAGERRRQPGASCDRRGALRRNRIRDGQPLEQQGICLDG